MTPRQSRWWKNSFFSRPKKPSQAALSGLHPSPTCSWSARAPRRSRPSRPAVVPPRSLWTTFEAPLWRWAGALSRPELASSASDLGPVGGGNLDAVSRLRASSHCRGAGAAFIFRRSASFESYRTLIALSSRSKMPSPFQDWVNKQSVFSPEAFF